jgi:hypothetical protein
MGISTVVLIGCVSIYADGVDLAPYLMRFNTYGFSVWSIIAIAIALMVANYIANLIVIGLPSIIWCQVNKKQVIVGLAFLTLLGQFADRLGAILAGFATALVNIVISNERYWPEVLTSFNFIFSGLFVGLLAWYYIRIRWHALNRKAIAISLSAAIITNPAYLLLIMRSQ